MPRTAKQRSRVKPAVKPTNARRRIPAEFPSGSLEADLARIGKSAPAKDWAKPPADYFGDLDRYLHGSPTKA